MSCRIKEKKRQKTRERERERERKGERERETFPGTSLTDFMRCNSDMRCDLYIQITYSSSRAKTAETDGNSFVT